MHRIKTLAAGWLLTASASFAQTKDLPSVIEPVRAPGMYESAPARKSYSAQPTAKPAEMASSSAAVSSNEENKPASAEPAEEQPSTAVAQNAGRSAVYGKQAVTKLNLKDYEGAITDAKNAISLNPKNTQAYLTKAQASGFLRNYYEAVLDATEAIKLEPENVSAYN
ncbi:MAG: hypothetical protein NTW04_00875, partial [Elusimicrobia bacterium]|nr:hypothetical protein [Elusimicrobiota bacterium]